MTLLIHQGQILGDISDEISRLKTLVADLERLASGEMPTERQLAAAPLLDNYVPATRSMLCLAGCCTDHPHVSGPIITTTEIWVLAPELGWCRTLSRYYRLGHPAAEIRPS